MANLIFSILSEYNGKGLAKGKKDVVSFEKTLKSLGKTLGVTLGAAAIVNFSKKAIAAFAADQSAAKSLEIQLKNTGYAFSAPDIEYYIANLQKMTGVLDDHLRPAFQTLLTASGSLIQSQKALAIALDVSAATGKSVEEVSMALAKGFTGQTTALGRLGAGLDKATLASGDMNKIMDELSNKFSGQAKARLETYAGKMDKLKVATADATEIIGKGLLDALSSLGTDKSLDKFSNDLNTTATSVSYLVAGVASLAGEVNKLFNIKVGTGSALDFLLRNAPVVSAYYNAGKTATAKANAPKSNFTYSLGSGAGSELAKKKELDLLKKTNTVRAVELSALTKRTAVDQLKDKFDLDRIELYAALNAATDQETKLRLLSKIAILDNNEILAKKYLAEMNAAEAAKKLGIDLTNAGNQAYQAFNGILNLLGRGGDQGPGQGLQYGTNITNNYYSTSGGMSPSMASTGGNTNVIVNTQGMIETTRITELVQEGILRAKYEGRNLNPAGGL